MSLKLATPKDARLAVDAIPGKLEIPGAWGGKVDGFRLQVLDRLAILGGFRVSELVTVRTSNKSDNTSGSLSLSVDTEYQTGEEVLLIRVNALKKKGETFTREIGIPLNSDYEPWSKPVLKAWEYFGGNPFNISRQIAWAANRIVFDGLGYRVKKQPELKNAGNHFMRHIRAEELRHFQLTPEERMSFFGWSPGFIGLSTMIYTYDSVDWFQYFPKLLKRMP